MIRTLLLVLSAVLMSAVNVFLLQYSDIKNERKIAVIFKSAFALSKKKAVFIVLMFALNISMAVVFTFLYDAQTILFSLKRFALISLLWVAAFYDYKSFRIPNKLILLGLIYRFIILIAEFFFEFDTLLSTIVSELIAAAALLLLGIVCNLLMKNSIGMGDVKLFILMGLFQGVSGVIYSVFISLLVSFFSFVVMLIISKKTKKDVIPFAPAILCGTYISVILTGI